MRYKESADLVEDVDGTEPHELVLWSAIETYEDRVCAVSTCESDSGTAVKLAAMKIHRTGARDGEDEETTVSREGSRGARRGKAGQRSREEPRGVARAGRREAAAPEPPPERVRRARPGERLCPENPNHGPLLDIRQSTNYFCPHSDHHAKKTRTGILLHPGVFTYEEARG